MTTKYKNIITVCLVGVILFGLAITCWLKAPSEYSDSERRALAEAPELSIDTVLSGDFMGKFETYTQDQFPMRDKFRALKSIGVLYGLGQMENNDLYMADGHISKLEYPLRKSMLDHAAERFEHIYEKYLTGNNTNVYFSIIPDKNYFIAEQNGYLSVDYNELISYMKEKTNYMEYIDILGLLSIDDYYRTDTHWRQERVIDVAQKLAKGMGVELASTYNEETLDFDFYGVYHGQLALPVKPDTIKYLTNDALSQCIVTSYDTGIPITKSVYDMDKAYGKDPYEMFLSGSDALIVVENPNAKTDKELVIFRDSFASSLTPMLVEGYAKITLVDIRYVQSDMVGAFVEFDNQDVLFLYSTMLLNNSLSLK